METFSYVDGTKDAVKAVLEGYHSNRTKRLRIWLGDTATGKPWLEEHDTMGYIGRSTGERKVPLLIPNSNSTGGGAILTDCIVALQDVATKKFIYKMEGFEPPNLTKTVATTDNDYPVAVAIVGGDVQARFKSEQKANRYIAFMRGERMAK